MKFGEFVLHLIKECTNEQGRLWGIMKVKKTRQSTEDKIARKEALESHEKGKVLAVELQSLKDFCETLKVHEGSKEEVSQRTDYKRNLPFKILIHY